MSVPRNMQAPWRAALPRFSPRAEYTPSGRLSFNPGRYFLSKLHRGASADILTQAVDRQELSPRSVLPVRPAKMLPGQLDRIRGACFGGIEDVRRDFIGGFDSIQAATTAYRILDAVLIDGILYKGNTVGHLRPRSSRLPFRRVPLEFTQASLYESWLGNRWFGNWLTDDCLAYRLAETIGSPVTTDRLTGHKADYENRLAMRALRADCAHFRELILFDDTSHNDGKQERATDMRRRLIGDDAPRHPGAFLLRGRSGDERILQNERQVADHLAVRRGFTVIDPSSVDLDTIITACAGADVVAGVEGSHLTHGLMVMPDNARAFVIQPPTRAVSALKRLTDRQGQDYALVIGDGHERGFRADIGEIERTLDLA